MCLIYVLALALMFTPRRYTRDFILFSFCVISTALWLGSYLAVLQGLEGKLYFLNRHTGSPCTSWRECLQSEKVQQFLEHKAETVPNVTPKFASSDILNLTDWGNHPFSMSNGTLLVVGLFWAATTAGFTVAPRGESDHYTTPAVPKTFLWVLFALLQTYTWTPFVTVWLVAGDLALSTILCYAATSNPNPLIYFRNYCYPVTSSFAKTRLGLLAIALNTD